MNVATNIDDAGTMLRKRGLEPDGRVQRMFTAACAKEMDRYVPFSAGSGVNLKNQRRIKHVRARKKKGIDQVVYPGPYAQFLYYGKLMIGEKSKNPFAKSGERKIVTKIDLSFHGAPDRGPFWDRRMWQDKKTKIVNDVAKAAGGTPG